MSQTVSLVLSAQMRQSLQTIVDDRRQAVKHVLCARIVLLSDERLPVLEVARQAGVSRPVVWRWQQRFAEEGLDGLLRDKTRPPGTPATPQEDVRRFRETVGPDMDLLLEMHRRLTPAEAVELARLVETSRPMWLEDPIRPEFTAEMGDVARRTTVPVATGERFLGLAEFRQQIAAGPIAYARISVGVAGGITGARKIAALAEAHNILVAPHNPLSPVALAAYLHIAAIAPNFAIQEYPTGFHNLALQSDGRLLGGDLVTWTPPLEGGFAALPDAPGLGTAVLDRAAEIAPPTTRRVSMRLHRDGSPIDQ